MAGISCLTGTSLATYIFHSSCLNSVLHIFKNWLDQAIGLTVWLVHVSYSITYFQLRKLCIQNEKWQIFENFQNFKFNFFIVGYFKSKWLGRILDISFLYRWMTFIFLLKTFMHRPFLLRYVKKEQKTSRSGRILTFAA